MKLLMRISKYLFLFLITALLLANVVNIIQSVALGQEMPLLFGYGRAVVVTGSMEPVISAGDMIIIQERVDYETDDIITYKANSYITHRIVETTENGYITQGDANNIDDGEILRSQVIGKVVWIIPGAGNVVTFFKSPFGMLMLIITFVAMIEVPNMIGKNSKRRRHYGSDSEK